MKRKFLTLMMLSGVMVAVNTANAQTEVDTVKKASAEQTGTTTQASVEASVSTPKTYAYDSITKGKYTLIVNDESPDFDPAVKKRLIDAYFEVYPKEAKLYNPKTVTKVYFWIDPLYDGVAEAGGNKVRFNPAWFKKKPGDIDVVTHEVMHLVQAYPGWAGPGWITEGIADYVRYTMGIDNAGAGWTLTPFKADQSYKNAYRITARFFVWIEKNKKKGLVKKLDGLMRKKEYKDDFWKNETGKTVDELWAEYAANPVI